ncbi:MAG: thioredoxin family protein [Pseudomonadota bacterium]
MTEITTKPLNRRHFLTAGLALGLAPLATRPAFATGFVEYAPGAVEGALSRGETVFVDYSAVWCGTCRRQERVVNNLRATNPVYDQAMTFIRVDWDTYRTHPVTTSRSIPRRSTLLVLRGNQELGRIVAGTSATQIRLLMDLGLA